MQGNKCKRHVLPLTPFSSLTFSPFHSSSLIILARKEDVSCQGNNMNTRGWGVTIYRLLKPDIISITPGVWGESRNTKRILCNLNTTDLLPPPQQHTHTQKVCILHKALEDHKSMHEKDVVEIFGGIRVYFCHLCETATHSSRSQLRKKLVTEISSFSSAAKSPACEGREKLTN